MANLFHPSYFTVGKLRPSMGRGSAKARENGDKCLTFVPRFVIPIHPCPAPCAFKNILNKTMFVLQILVQGPRCINGCSFVGRQFGDSDENLLCKGPFTQQCHCQELFLKIYSQVCAKMHTQDDHHSAICYKLARGGFKCLQMGTAYINYAASFTEYYTATKRKGAQQFILH